MRIKFLGWLTIAFTAVAAAEAKPAGPPPNIVFFLADDFGMTDMTAYAAHFTGAKPAEMFYETPNLDRLAARGTAFAQAYACPLCSPTRSSILTGKYAARNGFTTAVGGNVKTYYNQGLTPPPGYLPQDALFWEDTITIPKALINGTTIDALPSGQPTDNGRNEITIAEALKSHDSAFLGKWHLGGHGSKGYQPSDQGFEELAYFDEGGSPYFNWRGLWNSRQKTHPKMPQPELLRGKAPKPEPGKPDPYLTDNLADIASDYIRSRVGKNRPFFLYFCHFAVHSPIQAKPEDIAHFEAKSTRGWNGHTNATYAAMIKSLDNAIGRVVQTLDECGLSTNTIVVFMSDNGGVSWTTRPKEALTTCNAPFKGGKAMLFEGGIRVPLMFSWPGHIPAGQWCQVPVDCNDLFPTLLDLAGQSPKPYYREIDGRSLAPLFADLTNRRGDYPRTRFFWHYPLNVIVPSPDDGFPLPPHSAIREGDYKLVFDWSGVLRLYNLAADPFEKQDLAAAEPRRVRQMFRELNDWIDSRVAVKYTPALNPDYRPEQEVRSRPFVDLRRQLLGGKRAIRPAASDPRLR